MLSHLNLPYALGSFQIFFLVIFIFIFFPFFLVIFNLSVL